MISVLPYVFYKTVLEREQYTHYTYVWHYYEYMKNNKHIMSWSKCEILF